MDLEELTPCTALRVIVPAGVAVSTRLVRPPPSWQRVAWTASVTVAWEEGSDEAERMAQHVDRVAREMVGPDGPALVRSGDLWTPLRHGDRDRPGDARLAGRVFAEIEGDLWILLDARRKPVRPLDLWNPAALEFAGEGSVVRPQVYLFVPPHDGAERRIRIQLANVLAVRRGAPGWEAWSPDGALPS